MSSCAENSILRSRAVFDWDHYLTCSRQSIVYQKLRSEGYPTEKTNRAKLLEAYELSRQPPPGSSPIAPVLPPMDRNSFTLHHNHQNTDFAFYPSTSNPLTQQSLMTSATVDPSVLEYSNTSKVKYDVGLSTSVTLQKAAGYADVSIIQNLDTTTNAGWTAELPVVQRHDDLGVDQNALMAAEQTMQAARNENEQAAPFDDQNWLYNSMPLSDCHGQQQDAMSWEQDGLDNIQLFDSSTSTEHPKTTPLLILTETNIPAKENSLAASTLRRFSTGARTQLEITTINLPEQDGMTTPVAVECNDVLMSTPVNSIDPVSSSHTSQNGTRDSHESGITPSPTDSSSFGGRMIGVTRKARSGLMNMIIKRDSGYASGRNSPLTLSTEDNKPDPSSLLEFKGLHRVPCQRLHQPPPIDTFYVPESKIMERFKETPTCSQCQYSSIHNLSWSAQYLGLAVFKAELKLDTKYDIAALDKAGNSALHYAASGGAGFEHFAALILAGVDPYQINTAGQLFLHCLRPHIREIGSVGFDDKLVTGFHTDLVDLLNDYQPKGAFRWRDNEGRTVLDALASNISNAEVRARTFRYVICRKS